MRHGEHGVRTRHGERWRPPQPKNWIPPREPAENFSMQHDPRRASPRIGTQALCWEIDGDRERSSLVVDLSSEGARLERPYAPRSKWDVPLELGPAGASTWMPGSRHDGVIPLQLELPEIDEVLWARGDVVFDELVPVSSRGGPFGLVRRTGLHLSLGARRDLHLLRDWIYEMHARQRAANDDNAVDWLRCFG